MAIDAYDSWHRLDFESGCAVRYHMKRRSFLEGLAKLGPVVSLVLGTAAAGTLLGGKDTTIALWASLLTTVFSAANLSFGVADRARLHDALFRRWMELRGDMSQVAPEDEAGVKALLLKRAKIDADSPGQIDVLTYIVEDDEREARGEARMYQLRWYQRLFADWFTLPPWTPDGAKG